MFVLASGSNVEPPVLAKRAGRAVGTTLASTTAVDVEYSTWFDSSDCSGAPYLLYAVAVCMTYSSDGCSAYTPYGHSACGEEVESVDTYYNEGCSDDWGSVPDKLYGDEPFFRIDYFVDADCSEFDSSTVSLADGDCHAYSGVNDMGYTALFSVLTTINANESATRSYFNSGDCSGEARTVIMVDAALLSSSACDGNGTIAYTNTGNTGSAADSTISSAGNSTIGSAEDSTTGSARGSIAGGVGEESEGGAVGVGDDESNDSDGLSTGAIVGIVVGAAAVVAIIAVLILCRRRRRSDDTYRDMPAADQ